MDFAHLQGWPWRRRVGLLALATAGYTALFLAVRAPVALSLRPLNLLFVVVGGLLLGFRGGLLYAVCTVVLNVTLYAHAGVLAPDRYQLSSNLLSVVLGMSLGALVGHIRDLTFALRGEVQRRKYAEHRKDELTALLVHDLKNPLGGIIGHANLLALGPLPSPEQRESVLWIRDSAEEVDRMVMNLLDIGRAEEGRLQPNRQVVVVGTLAQEVRASLALQVEERGQRLEIVEAEAAGTMAADPDLLRRMLLNLVDNAIKYTPQRRTIRIELGGDLAEVELAVRDEGPGIPVGYEEKIFEKYVRLARDQQTAAHVSRGLGLLFCRLAAQSHGGRIWVEPSPPQGSVFKVRLPRTAPPLPS